MWVCYTKAPNPMRHARQSRGPHEGPRWRASKFLQSMHLQLSEQKMEAWKHSQYFFRQPLFLQLQPLLCLGAGADALFPSSGPPCTVHMHGGIRRFQVQQGCVKVLTGPEGGGAALQSGRTQPSGNQLGEPRCW